MKKAAGLWIDHKQATIVFVTDNGEETRVIESHVEKQPRRAEGARHEGPFDPSAVQMDNAKERERTGHLNSYYDGVVAALHDAEAILIFGPGEAKGELKKRLEKHKLGERIAGMETSDKMTDRQIVAKVKKHFEK